MSKKPTGLSAFTAKRAPPAAALAAEPDAAPPAPAEAKRSRAQGATVAPHGTGVAGRLDPVAPARRCRGGQHPDACSARLLPGVRSAGAAPD